MPPGWYARALYPFLAGDEGDLSLSPGDVLGLSVDPAATEAVTWLRGTNVLTLASGYFPRECRLGGQQTPRPVRA